MSGRFTPEAFNDLIAEALRMFWRCMHISGGTDG